MGINRYIPKNKRQLKLFRETLAILIKKARAENDKYKIKHYIYIAENYCYKGILLRLARVKKQKELYKKIAIKLLANEIKYLKDYNIPVKIRISTTPKSKTYVKSQRYGSTNKLFNVSLNINIPQIKRIYQNGFGNDYYPERANLLNRQLLHNRKKTLEFVLLHEINHIKLSFHNKLQRNTRQNEKFADKIALKRLGLERV